MNELISYVLKRRKTEQPVLIKTLLNMLLLKYNNIKSILKYKYNNIKICFSILNINLLLFIYKNQLSEFMAQLV